MIPDPFLLIADPKVLAVPIFENHEPLVELRHERWMLVDVPQENAPRLSKVRLGVMKHLRLASKSLPKNFRIKLIEGYRPPRIQKEYFDEYTAILRKQNPKLSVRAISKKVSMFVAPPGTTPPHTTGAAVDITLVDRDGKDCDLGTESHKIGEYSEKSLTRSRTITSKQRRLRNILSTVLSEAGFVNYPAEWWHWSYGDRYWAYYTKSKNALYDTIRKE